MIINSDVKKYPVVALVLLALLTACNPKESKEQKPVMKEQRHGIRLCTEPNGQSLSFFSWDTEDRGNDSTNLLKESIYLILRTDTREIRLDPSTEKTTDSTFVYSDDQGNYVQIRLAIKDGGTDLILDHSACNASKGAKILLCFPFEPAVSPVTVFPASWVIGGDFTLPAILSAPGYGQLILQADQGTITGEFHGKRINGKRAEIILSIPMEEKKAVTFSFSPYYLPAPEGYADTETWERIRLEWFDVLQLNSQWSEKTEKNYAPSGIYSNNIISDPTSIALYFYADHAFFTPYLTNSISLLSYLRKSIEFWQDEKMHSNGEIIGYRTHINFLDANPSILISAWVYVEATGDTAWLNARIDKMEKNAGFLISRDIDDDGISEATQSGNRNSLYQPDRSSCWFDALNFGHKDAYSNALIFRAYCCMADLEKKLGRHEKEKQYKEKALQLKENYSKELFNDELKTIAMWRSADGELHDYVSPTINGMAVVYGLVDSAKGRELLLQIHEIAGQQGFTRYELGFPITLLPVKRYDYLLPDANGCPKKEDGTDSFQQYMNGGIFAGQSHYFILAHYMTGLDSIGNMMLDRMMEHLEGGGFHNGVVYSAGEGIDWTDWDGKPTGYEGYLAENSRFTAIYLLREKRFRDQILKPMLEIENF